MAVLTLSAKWGGGGWESAQKNEGATSTEKEKKMIRLLPPLAASLYREACLNILALSWRCRGDAAWFIVSIHVPVSAHSEELTTSADDLLELQSGVLSSACVNGDGIRCFPEETLQVWALCRGASSCRDSPVKHLLQNKPKDGPKGQQTSDDVGVSPSPLLAVKAPFPFRKS